MMAAGEDYKLSSPAAVYNNRTAGPESTCHDYTTYPVVFLFIWCLQGEILLIKTGLNQVKDGTIGLRQERLYLLIRFLNSSSVRMVTPRSLALSSLEPGFSPATR